MFEDLELFIKESGFKYEMVLNNFSGLPVDVRYIELLASADTDQTVRECFAIYYKLRYYIKKRSESIYTEDLARVNRIRCKLGMMSKHEGKKYLNKYLKYKLQDDLNI